MLLVWAIVGISLIAISIVLIILQVNMWICVAIMLLALVPGYFLYWNTRIYSINKIVKNKPKNSKPKNVKPKDINKGKVLDFPKGGRKQNRQ